jgi:hypothetical protein
MPTAVLNPLQNRFGAGTIYMAPLGTAVPILAASGGVFTTFVPGAPPTGWTPVGGTTTGLTLTRQPTFSDFLVAESYYPQAIVMTADDVQGNFTLAQINRQNLAFAYNAATANTVAGTGDNYSVTGSGANTITQFNLPLVGTEVDCMLCWVGEQSDECAFLYQCKNVAAVAPNATKGPMAQELLFQLRAQLPAVNPDLNCGQTALNVRPYRWYFTGTNN